MKKYSIGLDVGSTTVKTVILDDKRNIVFSTYRRHFSDVRETVGKVLEECRELLTDSELSVTATGSGGMGIAQLLNTDFAQEVISATKAVEEYLPGTDVAIELGGEDAKITYFGKSCDQRMNGTCAGGTGAFIDQMAALLKTDASGLNEMASRHKNLYPIAARCGVFAKTDVQPLINEGARAEDIAASIFQAVVNQTIGGLAQGRPIRGKVAFLGGPLHYLPELRKRFTETLNLTEENIVAPDNANIFVALGAALISEKGKTTDYKTLTGNLKDGGKNMISEVERLEPLFKNHIELSEFMDRHEREKAGRRDIEKASGPLFLGIDAGSTTSKIVLTDRKKNILYTFYGSNEGKPLDRVVEELKKVWDIIPPSGYIASSCVTGYGENLIKEALGVDIGEIETIAHYKASEHFLPGVEFILDIGGQDMKCLKVHDGVIDSILLNEACSSGCGSFIETFAESLNSTPPLFAQEALKSTSPVDLGTRCTVFMNSRVKQAQKEGATVADISAGLSYSVIKNALYKVIKIRNPEELGRKVIVQGGTFHNDAVLRAFEKTAGVNAVRPDIAGLMGAFGASIIAGERWIEGTPSSLKKKDELSDFSYEVTMRRCGLCQNNCRLTVNCFSSGNEFISGNRCDRPLGKLKGNEIPDGYRYRNKRAFGHKSLTKEEAVRGTIGMPRVLNMYENYPFWHKVFTELGFRVILSPPSDKNIFTKGIETIPSESVCYPGKLVHGHMEWLIEKKPDIIFYPCIPYERKEFLTSDNNYNCPIVTSYPEVMKNNLDNLKNPEIRFIGDFLNIGDEKNLYKRMKDIFSFTDITEKEWKEALKKGFEERDSFRDDMRKFGEDTLKFMEENHVRGIVLAGRPYHSDPEINHGIPDVITSSGMAVLTEDSVCHLEPEKDLDLRVMDQWAYHSRLYHAASFVAGRDDLELIQLNSFGCGLDAVTTDQVEEILKSRGKIYTCLKIDEGDNLGAARIRIRSLRAAMEERERNNYVPKQKDTGYDLPVFTKEMKEKHTVIMPQLSPIHMNFIESALLSSGLNVVLLPEVDKGAVEEGLKYVNNDACYPSILVTGQMIHALKSGKYDTDNTTVVITQTGGGCRATNYVAFIRKALKDAGFGHVPCVPLSVQGFENHPGMKLGLKTILKAAQGAIYGDLLMRVLYRVRPYEKEKGTANALYHKWDTICRNSVKNGNFKEYSRNIRNIVSEFDSLPITNEVKPKVGLVGEILVKFHPTANNSVVDIVENEGCEAVMPDFTDFFLYSALDSEFKYKYLGQSIIPAISGKAVISAIELLRRTMRKSLEKSERFSPPADIYHLASITEPVISLGNMTGEGWFLTGEMLELLETGVHNIICMQPFACLPNHVTGKGIIKKLREIHPEANIAAIDYDPGASEVNQLNRIKLMISVAFKNLEGKNVYEMSDLRQKSKAVNPDYQYEG